MGNPFTNYDRTAQNSGVPPMTSPHHEELEEEKGLATHEVTADHAAVEKEMTAGSSNGTQVEDDSELERRESIVHDLARRYTTQSNATGVAGNPYLDAGEDSPLNPHSPHFNARAWAKAVVNIADREGHGFRTAGVCFQNLNVHGFGAATDYQKDVANVLLETAGVVRKIMGVGERKIDILQGYDGVVHKGEMLVVLGPPGSGCSTFLKTIAGETSGIYVDDKSYFNYQGKNRPIFISATRWVLR